MTEHNASFNELAATLHMQLVSNAISSIGSRGSVFPFMTQMGGLRDIRAECGYPDNITPNMYHERYERDGLAARIVNLYPEESWTSPPLVHETEKQTQTTQFEEDMVQFINRHNLWSFLKLADELSGVGRFGIILIGLDDGRPLDTEVEGYNPSEIGAAPNVKRNVTYLRAFDESVVSIHSTEEDRRNPRYGQPTMYRVNYYDELSNKSVAELLHYSRVIHIIDNRTMSLIHGVPRLKPIWDRLMDIDKILPGSGEMFWKGAYPGYSLETAPGFENAVFDRSTISKEITDFTNGLNRYMALQGIQVKSLSPQIASPKDNLESNIEFITIYLKCPKRIFMGSEQGELASSQDSKNWNNRMMKRCTEHLEPHVIRPFINRLIYLGVVHPPVIHKTMGNPVYDLTWQDLNTTSRKEKTEIGLAATKALEVYIRSGMEDIIDFETYLVRFLGFEEEVAAAMAQAANYSQSDTTELPDDHDHADDEEMDDEDDPDTTDVPSSEEPDNNQPA